MNWTAVLAGSVAGFTIAGLLLLRKKNAIEARGSAIEAGLAQLGETYANEVARTSADDYMRDVYGITPERMQSVGRLVTAMGINL